MVVNSKDLNRDPVTGEPGSHPIGTGIGAASFALAGAAIGTAAGPVGTATGAVVGAIAGGIAGAFVGKEIAEYVNPTEVEAYWEYNYQSRPYVSKGEEYDSYRPAYRMGYDAVNRHKDKAFNEIESDLEGRWQSQKNSSLSWDKAKNAARDSYEYTSNLYRKRLEDPEIKPRKSSNA